MKSEKELKEKFVEMFKFVVPSGKGFICLYENIEYDDDNKLSEDTDYPFLKKKMKRVLRLINSDLSLLDKDLETEIWDMV